MSKVDEMGFLSVQMTQIFLARQTDGLVRWLLQRRKYNGSLLSVKSYERERNSFLKCKFLCFFAVWNFRRKLLLKYASFFIHLRIILAALERFVVSFFASQNKILWISKKSKSCLWFVSKSQNRMKRKWKCHRYL